MNMKQLVKTATLVVIAGTANLALAEGYTNSPSDNRSPAATQDNRSPAASRDNSSPQANDNRTASQRIEDAAITTRVKAKLAADDRVKATDINVDTMNGIVTLYGTVKNDSAKTAAEELAKQVEGVASIDNQITTGATGSIAQQKGGSKRAERVASDSWITTKVKSTLLADHVTKGLNIGVKTMNGTVSLSGTVSSQTEFDRAVQVAKNIKGVKNVNTNQLQITSQQ